MNRIKQKLNQTNSHKIKVNRLSLFDKVSECSSSDHSAASSANIPSARSVAKPIEKKSIVTIASQKSFKNTLNGMLSDNRVRNDKDLDSTNQLI